MKLDELRDFLLPDSADFVCCTDWNINGQERDNMEAEDVYVMQLNGNTNAYRFFLKVDEDEEIEYMFTDCNKDTSPAEYALSEKFKKLLPFDVYSINEYLWNIIEDDVVKGVIEAADGEYPLSGKRNHCEFDRFMPNIRSIEYGLDGYTSALINFWLHSCLRAYDKDKIANLVHHPEVYRAKKMFVMYDENGYLEPNHIIEMYNSAVERVFLEHFTTKNDFLTENIVDVIPQKLKFIKSDSPRFKKLTKTVDVVFESGEKATVDICGLDKSTILKKIESDNRKIVDFIYYNNEEVFNRKEKEQNISKVQAAIKDAMQYPGGDKKEIDIGDLIVLDTGYIGIAMGNGRMVNINGVYKNGPDNMNSSVYKCIDSKELFNENGFDNLKSIYTDISKLFAKKYVYER